MKVQEFIDKRSQLKNVSIIEAKEYLPFAEKKALAERIVNACTENDNGAIRINEIDKYIIFTIECAKAYTNLEFDEDIDVAMTEYDELCMRGLLGEVINTFAEEYKIILELVKMQSDYVMQSNSIEYSLAKFLNNINEKLDGVSEVLSSKMTDLNFESLGISEDNIKNLMDFVDGASK